MATNVLTEAQLNAGRAKKHAQQARDFEARLERLRDELASGKSQAQVAREWGITPQMVSKLLKRRKD